MDWIETLFHLDPDAGSGLFEIAITLLVGFVIAFVAVRLSRKRRRARTRAAGGIR